MEHDLGIRAGGIQRLVRLAVLALAFAAAAALAVAGQARAQDAGPPAQLIVTVVPPSDRAPQPTGDVVVSVNGRPLLALPLVRGLEPLTAATPLANAALAALGQEVKIGYSGDNNYEASDGVVLSVPTNRELITIVPRLRDTDPPTIDIVSPGDGVRYERGEAVVAVYSCTDPDTRSAVTTCAGPVPTGSAIDTSSSGSFTFTVTASDDLGNATPKSVSYTVGSGAGPNVPTPSTPGSTPPGAPPPPAAAARAAPDVAGLPAVVAAAVQAAQETSPDEEAPKEKTPATSKSAATGPAEPAPGAEPADGTPTVRQQLTAYDPRSEPEKTFGILAAGFTLLTLAVGGGGIARGGGVGKSGSGTAGAAPKGGTSRPGFSGLSSYQGVEVRFLAAGFGAVALGDKSRTWRWPGTQRIDYLSAALPVALARRSPLLGRVLADSAYLRAILGSTSLLFPLAGLGLGIAAVQSSGGEALPPATALVIAIAVIGALDATAGFVALTTFVIGVLALGGMTTGDDARFMLGIGALWAVVPVLAGVTRPLRRRPTPGVVGAWDRGADFIVVALVGAWAVQRIVAALPGLKGVELEIAAHADEVALFVLGALVVRVALETVASHYYPLRLDDTAAAAFPTPTKLVMIGSALGRTVIYTFLLYVLVGYVWQLWVAAGLFLLTQLIWVYPEKAPNSSWLYRAIPKGITQFTVFLFGYTLAWLLMNEVLNTESESFFPNVMVGFGLVGLILPLPLLFARSGEPRKIGWGKRFLGLGVLILAVLQVRGYLL